MPDYTINIPIREEDAEDVKNAFAQAYGYSDLIPAGNGVMVANPITKEQFVQQCCVNFMLNVTKSYMIKVEEIAAATAATELAAIRAQEVVQWFDSNRLDSIGGIAIYQNFPQVVNNNYNVSEGSILQFALLATDLDNLPLTYTITQYPVGGIITGTLPDLTYTPNSGFYGEDILKFKANNGTKNSLEGLINIQVNGKPIAESQNLVTEPNVDLNITLHGIDPESEQISYQITSQPLSGTLSGTAPDLIYTPNSDYIGSDSFTFNVSDGVLTSYDATISININAKPIALSQTLSTTMNTPFDITLQGTDQEGSELIFDIVTGTTLGTLTGSFPTLTYTPNANLTGSDSFTFTVTDGVYTSDQATVTIDII